MPSSDGFSIKTTIAQMGQVARSQVKSQQASPAAHAHGAETVQKEQRPDKVKKTEETEKSRTDPDRRRGRQDPSSGDGGRQGERDEAETPVGNRLDTKA